MSQVIRRKDLQCRETLLESLLVDKAQTEGTIRNMRGPRLRHRQTRRYSGRGHVEERVRPRVLTNVLPDLLSFTNRVVYDCCFSPLARKTRDSPGIDLSCQLLLPRWCNKIKENFFLLKIFTKVS